MLRSFHEFLSRVFGALGVIGLAAYITLCIGLVLGYFFNIWKLVMIGMFGSVGDQVVMFILRIAGLFVGPLGGVIGWF